jgi:hypothetical protein
VRAVIADLLDVAPLRDGARRALQAQRILAIDVGRADGGYLLGPIALTRARKSARGATRAIQALSQENWPSCARMLSDRDHFGIAIRQYENMTERRLAAVLLALRLFEAELGSLPERLSELVPAYLPAIPSDPFAPDNRPLAFLSESEHGPLIYSVGRNAIDDAGSRRVLPVIISGKYAGRLDQKDIVAHVRRQPRLIVNSFLDADEAAMEGLSSDITLCQPLEDSP